MSERCFAQLNISLSISLAVPSQCRDLCFCSAVVTELDSMLFKKALIQLSVPVPAPDWSIKNVFVLNNINNNNVKLTKGSLHLT
jgi:hypothetical protein